MKDTTPLNFEFPQLLWVPVHLLTRVMYNTVHIDWEIVNKNIVQILGIWTWNKKKKLLVLKEIHNVFSGLC